MPNYNLNNRGINPPKLDTYKQSIRDKIYASENELNTFIETFRQQITDSTNRLKLKNSEVQENYETFQLDSQYYNERTAEIDSVEINNTLAEINLKGNEYLNKSEKFKSDTINEFKQMANSLDFDKTVLGRIQNKIESFRTFNDNNKPIRLLSKDENNSTPQQFSRLNHDNYSNTRFYNKIYIPFGSDFNTYYHIGSIDPLPANYKTPNKNSPPVSFIVKIFLRSNNLVADLFCISSNNPYGIIKSDCLINLEVPLNLFIYYDETNNKLDFLIKLSEIGIENSLENIGNLSIDIGFEIVLGGNVSFPNDISSIYDISLTNRKYLTHCTLPVTETTGIVDLVTPDYMTYDEFNSHEKHVLSEDDIIGSAKLLRISTIEQDYNQMISDNNIKNITTSTISYSIPGESETRVIKSDNIGEILLKSLYKAGLKEETVYKCFGFIILRQQIFFIEQLKLSKKYLNSDSNHLDQTEETFGSAEFLFDKRWELNDISDNVSSGDISVLNFPGITITGTSTWINTGTNQFNETKGPIRQAAAGSSAVPTVVYDGTKLNLHAKTEYNNYTFWNEKDSSFSLQGYDIVIITTPNTLDKIKPDLLNINIPS